MLVPQLLFDTLEDLVDNDLKTFKWFLTIPILDSCSPIRKSHLETASRTETVSKMIESYGEESAVNITVEILKKMNFNNAAEMLKKKHAGGKTTTSSSAVAPPAAPATMMAQQGSVIIAPTVTGGTSGSWNITINK